MIDYVILPQSTLSVFGIQYYLKVFQLALADFCQFVNEHLCSAPNSIPYELIADISICRENEVINFAAMVEETFWMSVRLPSGWWIVLSP